MADNTKRILRLHTDLARVMADKRFADGRRMGHDLRSFIVAYYWASFETRDPDERWERTKELAGVKGTRKGPTAHLRELYRADVPRYEPASYPAWAATCPSLMTRGPRAGVPCGHRGTRTERVTDPATGEWEMVGWCYRHSVDADEALAAERRLQNAGGIPKPLPNTGGLLPCYIPASNWPDIYADASFGKWEPPEIGIVADDWPVLAKVASHTGLVPRLTALDGDGETADDVAVPALRLVT